MLNVPVRTITRCLPPMRGSGRVYSMLDRIYVPNTSDERITSDVNGFRMKLNVKEYVDRYLLLAPQLYDWREVRILRSLIKPGSVVLDIGAHIGFYSLLFSHMVGKHGRVIAFEATPATYQRLVDHIDSNEANVTALNIGVSDEAGAQQLWVSTCNNAGGNTLIEKSSSTMGPVIQCRPLVAILKDHCIDHTDFVKLDIEGMEYRVFKKFFSDADKRVYPRYIMTEYLAERIPEVGGDIRDLFHENGYRVLKTCHSNIIFKRE